MYNIMEFCHLEHEQESCNKEMAALHSYAPINGIPPLPHNRVGWGNSGDLTEYHVKNPSAGASPDVNTPIYHQESIGD